MPSVLEVLLRGRNELSAPTKQATRDVEALGRAAEAAGKKGGKGLGELGQSVIRSGDAAHKGLAALSQLLGGAESQLGQFVSTAAMTADAIDDIGAAVTKLGAAGGALGVVSLILAEWGAVADQNARRIENATKPFETVAARVRELDSGTPLANLARSIGTTTEKLDALIRSSSTARQEVLNWLAAEKELAALREKQAIVQQAQADTFGLLNRAAAEGLQLQDIKTFYDGLFSALQNGVGVTGDFAGTLDTLNAQMAAAAAKAEEATASLDAQNAVLEANRRRWEALNPLLLKYAEFTSQASLNANRWEQYNTKVAASLGHTARSMLKTGQTLDEYNDKWDTFARDGAAKAQSAAERLRSTIANLARSVLQSTQVTQQDLDAAALGQYVEKWDELARQADDVAQTPANIEKYAELARALEQTGLSAKEFADQFRSMSLFADPANLNLVNWDAYTSAIRDKIRGLIGEANLMKEAFRQALASLSPQEMQQFTKALDLDPRAAGNVDKLFDAFTGKEVDESQAKLGDMASKITVISGTHTATLNFVWDKARTAIQEAHDFIEDKILQYADLLIEITARFTPPSSGGGGTPPPSGGNPPGRASGGYVGNGLYRLGEAGREYVLPHGLVRYIEKVLGGRIRDPRQIEWLIGALERGPGEARNQLEMWAAGLGFGGGGAVAAPARAEKWFDKIYDRYASEYGESAPGAVGAGGGGAAAGGGGGFDTEALRVLQSIDSTLKQMYRQMTNGGVPPAGGGNLVNVPALTREVSRELGRRATMRRVMGT